MKRSQRKRRRFAARAATFALVAAVGCSGTDETMGRVEGVVRLNGQPLQSGKVIFQPQAGRNALGVINADGTFTLTTGDSDGALIGEHKVGIVAFEGASPGRPDPTGPRQPLKMLVPERYLAPGTSGLTYEVKAGDNHPEFDLTTP
jgi:hypothetical protein